LNGEVELTDEVFASYNSKQWCEEQYETNWTFDLPGVIPFLLMGCGILSSWPYWTCTRETIMTSVWLNSQLQWCHELLLPLSLSLTLFCQASFLQYSLAPSFSNLLSGASPREMTCCFLIYQWTMGVDWTLRTFFHLKSWCQALQNCMDRKWKGLGPKQNRKLWSEVATPQLSAMFAQQETISNVVYISDS
jgi:hypothetical protein